MQNKYTAFTLLEMLVVMGIMMILMGMTFTSFSGLQDTVKMNEYMLNMEQDIRSVQRASMLLERNTEENWLYGLGIDFSKLKEEDGGVYTTFKWCTPYGDYGDPSTRGKVPGYSEGDLTLDGAKLPVGDIGTGLCAGSENTLKILLGYTTELTPPKSEVIFNPDSSARYVVFESVTGRAFFYDEDGELLNYFFDDNGQLVIEDSPSEVEELDFTIESLGAAAPRTLRIHHLSGRIEAIVEE
jgi:type II secretory pathway pseudopilin PulG